MSKTYDTIDERLAKFISEQQMFFVATAPNSESGHINLSPKGLDSLRILDERTVAYADLIGSGVETIAHLRENGRIVLMFCAFEGAPNIVRLHGRGEVIDPSHAEFSTLAGRFPEYKSLRAILRVHCDRISDSCGYGVPRYAYEGHRTQLSAWAEQKSDAEMLEYQRTKNRASIDGLPGIKIDD